MILEFNNSNNTVRVFNYERKIIATLFGTIEYFSIFNLSKDLQNMASANLCRGDIYLWNLKSGFIKKSLQINNKISCLTFSNNNDYLLIGSEDGSIIIYNLNNYYSIKLKDHTDPISDIIFAPNGKVFLSITPNIIYLYDFNNFSYKLKQTFYDNKKIYSVYFSPDSKFIATSGWNYEIKIWQISSSKIIDIIYDENMFILSIFSNDSKYIATKNYKNNINVFKIGAGKVFSNKIKKNSMKTNLQWEKRKFNNNDKYIEYFLENKFPLDISNIILEMIEEKECLVLDKKVVFIS